MKKILFLIGFLIPIGLSSIAQFVYIEDGSFKLNGEDFYPMVLNYNLGIRTNSNKDYWAAASGNYGNTNDYEANSKQEALTELHSHFQLIKDLGFNTIRCGIEPSYPEGYPKQLVRPTDEGKLFMKSFDVDEGQHSYEGDDKYELLNTSRLNILLGCISDVLSVAQSRGLKVILVTGHTDAQDYRGVYEDYLQDLAYHVRNNSALLAFDLCNEPAYFSSLHKEGLDKAGICGIVTNWINIMKSTNPNHLFTIGFARSSANVFRWDANSIPIDFASFHVYDEPAFSNDVYWYTKYCNKPWIIGETGLAADERNYDEQTEYANSTLRRCIDCGGAGYSWWQYQNVKWCNEEEEGYECWRQNHFGLLDHEGTTITSDPSFSVGGTPKPAAFEFKNFMINYTPKNSCPKLADYYNYKRAPYVRVSGKIESKGGEPIVGAVVVGNWVHDVYDEDTGETKEVHEGIARTFTKSDGTYELSAANGHLINRIVYSHLGWEADYTSLDEITVYNPLWGQTIDVGETKNFDEQTNVITSLFNVKGNGSEGGIVNINAVNTIILSTGTIIEKGARFQTSLIRRAPTASLARLSSCQQASKNSSYEVEMKPTTSEDELKINTSKLSADYNSNHDIQKFESRMVEVYPNPSEGYFQIRIPTDLTEQASINIYCTSGRLMHSINDNILPINEFNTSIWQDGIYIIRVCTSEGYVVKRLIKQ